MVDSRNYDNFDEVPGSVLEVGALEVLPGPRQARVDSELEIGNLHCFHVLFVNYLMFVLFIVDIY